MTPRRPWLALMALVTACGPLGAQEEPSDAAATANTAPETVRQVRVLETERGTLSATRSASVTIEPAQESRLASGGTGRVTRILKREGQALEAGEAFIELDDEAARNGLTNAELALESARINLRSAEQASGSSSAQAEAQQRSARTALEIAQTQYRQGQALFEAGGIAQSELTSLRAQLDQAEATMLQADDAVARSRRAPDEDLALLRVQVRQAETQLAQAREAVRESRITAPFAGTLSELLVEQGEFVGAGSPVATLVAGERQLARFRVPPEDANRLQSQTTPLYIRYNGLDYAAFITRSGSVPGQQRLVEIVAEVYPSQTRIPFGTVAELRYDLELAEGVRIPAGAVSTEGGQTYVFVVAEGRASQSAVSILAEASGEAVVEGIAPGARVIYPRPLDVRDGTLIEVVQVVGE